jgi:hypothetical protein
MLCLWHKRNFVWMCIFFLEVFNLSQLTFTVSSYPWRRKRGRWKCNQVWFCLNWQTPDHPLWRRHVFKKFRKLNPPLILLTAKQWKGDEWLKSSSNCWQESITKIAIYKGFGGWCCRERGCKRDGVKYRVWRGSRRWMDGASCFWGGIIKVSCTMSIQRVYGLFLVNSSWNQMLLNCISYNPITHSRVSTQNEKFRFFAVTLQECC